ncbi:MAG: OmpA family protein [Nitrospirae bacterium]|nr:OmpA family protein [Nitrospirota bacterium]
MTKGEQNNAAVKLNVHHNLNNALASSLLILVLSAVFMPGPCQAGQPPQEPERLRVALFPFANLSDDRDALRHVMPVLKSVMEDKGLVLVDEGRLEDFLLKRRVRDTGYVSRELAAEIGRALDVGAVMVGAVSTFRSGRNPAVGLSARLIDSSSGRILWADYASATGEDFTKILGLGTIDTMDALIPEVAEELLASFPPPPYHPDGKARPYRVAVMPLRNDSGVRDAGMIATYMFLVEMFKSAEFEPVEYGEVRRAIVDLRIRERGELDFRDIRALADALSVDAFLVGTVETYSDGTESSSPPEVSIAARIIDARTNRVLWCDSLQMNGDDDIIMLDWGRIRSVDGVAFRVVTKLMKRAAKVCRAKLEPLSGPQSESGAASRKVVSGSRGPVVSKPPPEGAGNPSDGTISEAFQEEGVTLQDPETARHSPPTPNVSRMVVFFDYGSTEIRSDAYTRLLGLTRSLAGRRIMSVSIEGHACAHGPVWSNYRISKERALAVRDFMLEHAGVPEDAVRVRFFGEDRLLYPERPVRESMSAPEAARNRRVLVTVAYQ